MREGRFFIARRPAHKARGLLWEFVGGKVEPGESGEEALRRECREELGAEIAVGRVYTALEHVYPDLTIRLTLYLARFLTEPSALEHCALAWILPEEIQNYDFCPADADILAALQRDGLPVF